MLLHVTSLPGRFGIGDLGPSARRWVDTLAAAGQRWWQVLPLGPSAGGDAPYGCLSAFAGNALLVSPEDLFSDGLLTKAELTTPRLPDDRVDFESVVPAKVKLLDRAWATFNAGGAKKLQPAFELFCDENADWLDDFALFMSLRHQFAGKSWTDWPAELVRRRPAAMKAAKRAHADAVRREQFLQFLFFRQWDRLHTYARERGVGIIGDVPMFVSFDSSDVWTHPHLFKLDAHRRPTVIAGVPPDYFSATGQLWGNPLYKWSAMKVDNFAWWTHRMRATLKQVDLLRIDHFRGFAACWEVPAAETTAIGGRWVAAPGEAMLSAFEKSLGGLPFIAEDLGVITPDVEALRDGFHLPGMRVLQFAFGDDARNPFLPHNYDRNTVAYTGTHDNDTAVGWFRSLSKDDRERLMRLLPGARVETIGPDMIRLAWSSVAKLAIAPAQDVLNLPGNTRMNTPGTVGMNWRWRLRDGQWTSKTSAMLREITETYGR